ncbi:MAG: hypothetical protein IJW99_07300 [Clostridia bacterium]|nr:hypothetical protein [Clostridia bacterium]
MEFSHCTYDEKNLTLHDCRATRVSLEDGELVFHFPNGFCIGYLHPENPYRKPIMTDVAEVRYHLVHESPYDADGYVFDRKKRGKAIRWDYSLKQLMADINEKGGQLEFLYQYLDGFCRIVKCELWFEKRPYHRECELFLHTDRVAYLWNNLREESLSEI